MSDPQLLCIPKHLRSVDEVLGCAAKMGLSNIFVLSEREDGQVVLLVNDLTLANSNWLLDKAKMALLLHN